MNKKRIAVLFLSSSLLVQAASLQEKTAQVAVQEEMQEEIYDLFNEEEGEKMGQEELYREALRQEHQRSDAWYKRYGIMLGVKAALTYRSTTDYMSTAYSRLAVWATEKKLALYAALRKLSKKAE
jgi:hypothetical protein